MQLKNKAERERFLENYKKWELFREIPELKLKFYRYEFSNGSVIIATEYAAMRFVSFGRSGAKYIESVSVKYHLLLDVTDKYKTQFSENEYKLYNPTGDSKTAIVEYMTKTKPDIEVVGDE